MESKLQKTNPTDYNLLTVQDLWKAHFQALSIILLMEFIKLNVNLDIIMKNVKRMELNTKTLSAILNIKSIKMI